MVESVVVTAFPVLFLVLLFGGGTLLRRRNIDMDGEPPIDRRIFYVSKYTILVLWAAMVVQSWGVRLSLVSTPGWLRGVSLVLWVGGFLLLFIGRLGLLSVREERDGVGRAGFPNAMNCVWGPHAVPALIPSGNHEGKRATTGGCPYERMGTGRDRRFTIAE